MSTTPAPQVSPAKVPAVPVAQLLALDQVLPDPNQPRKAFDEAALKELADSIRAEGLLHPILVKPNGKGYFIVDGERRYRAAKLAGLKDLPVLVRADLKDQDVTDLQLVANIQREDLTLPEQCDAVTRLVKLLGTAKSAAAKLGKSEAWVSKRAGAASLPQEVRKLIAECIVVDIEVAAGLGEAIEASKKLPDAENWHLRHLLQDARRGAVDRDHVRDAVKRIKSNVAYYEEQKRLEAKRDKEAAEAKAAGKPTSGEKKQAAEDNRWREEQRHANQVSSDRLALKKAVLDALYTGMNLGKQDGVSAPLAIDNSYSHQLGKTAESCKFAYRGYGDIAMLKRLAAGAPGKVMVDVEPMKLSLADAQRISDALKGTEGGKELALSFDHILSGADLREAVAKLAKGQVATLPLTRSEKEAAKKKKAKASAAKKGK